MADEHDPRLEAQLRLVLHAEADPLPFLVREQDVERARRDRRYRRLAVPAALLGAAAVLAVLVVGGVFTSGTPAGVGPSPSPTASIRPLASHEELVRLLGPGDTVLLQGEDDSPAGAAATVAETELGVIAPTDRLAIAVSCLGGSIDIVLRGPNNDIGTLNFNCSVKPYVGTFPGVAEVDGPVHLLVRASAGVRWRLVVAASASPGPSVRVVVPGPTPTASPSPEGLGVADEAIIVRVTGDTPERPDEIVVGAYVIDGSGFGGYREIARFPGSVVPPGRSLELPVRARISAGGRLALGMSRSIIVLDVTRPSAAPVVVDVAASRFSWGPDGRLAISTFGGLAVWAPADRPPTDVSIPDGVELLDLGRDPVWLADGSGLLAWRSSDGEARVVGRLTPDGSFSALATVPELYQRSGTERPVDRDGATLGLGCDSGGAAGGACVLVRSALSGTIQRWGGIEGDGGIADQVWAADDRSAWVLVRWDDRLRLLRTEATWNTGIADVDGGVNDLLQPAAIAGILEPTDDSLPGFVLTDTSAALFFTRGGVVTRLEETAGFAGWGTELPAYPAR